MIANKRVVVTGGAGFIGSHVVEQLQGNNNEIIVIDDLSSGKLSNLNDMDYTFYKVNLLSRVQIEKAISGADYVIHLAAKRSVPKSVDNPGYYFNVNIIGTYNVIEAARLAKVKRLINISSSSIYGDNAKFPTKEDSLPAPLSPYATSKLACEYMAKNYNDLYGLQTISLRLFNVFGPRQSLENQYSIFIPSFI